MEEAGQHPDGVFKVLEFMVHGDPERLKRPRGIMEPAVQIHGRNGPANDVHESLRRQNWATFPPANDRSRDPP